MAVATKKYSYERTHSVVDEHGEVRQEVTTRESYVPTELGYVKLYLQDILRLNGLPKSHHDVLMCVLKEMNWDNKVYLSGKLKKDILAFLGISLASLDKALASFVKEQILYQVERGVYRVNPYIFGKGKWEQIKAIRLTISYDANGRTTTTAVDKDQRKPFPKI